MHFIELLAPAGSEDAFFAAIDAGADAVYMGTDRFNARERAQNISMERLPYLVNIAHSRNVRVYLTLNIVFFDDEFQPAAELVSQAVNAGIDAVIVQDMGMITMLRKLFPFLEIHASTQMTTHNLEQCRLLAETGVTQVNFSRELSLDELKPLAAYLLEQAIVPEIFVHGAYCISYSGQCYCSGGLYGLPGNRGQCVQPCRREFTSSTLKDSDFMTPFNLKDNCAFQNVAALVEACGWKGSSEIPENVTRPLCSLKIEGRIKSPDYVWAVTSAWREQLDRLEAGQKLKQTDERLEFSMNRGFSTGYLESSISRDMFTSGMRDHAWTESGTVEAYRADANLLSIGGTEAVIKKLNVGDELAIYGKDGNFICNASIKELKNNKARITINGKLNGKILPGQKLFRIPHFLPEEALKELKKKLSTATPDGRNCVEAKEKPVSVTVSGTEGQPLETKWICSSGQVAVISQNILSAAQKRSLDRTVLEDKLGRLGGTGFTLEKINCGGLKDGLFLPLGELNEMRRKAVEQLSAFTETDVRTNREQKVPAPKGKTKVPRNVTVLHSLEEAEAFAESGTEGTLAALEVPVTFTEEYGYFLMAHPEIMPYFPAILMEQDMEQAEKLLDYLADGLAANSTEAGFCRVICENAGLLKSAFQKGFQVIPGFHLNVTNSYTAAEYVRRFNSPAIVASTELNQEQLRNLVLPEDTELWLIPEASRFLMQSRQCLVGRASGCRKKSADRECLETCSRSVELTGKQGEKITAVKRRGFYSMLVKTDAGNC